MTNFKRRENNFSRLVQKKKKSKIGIMNKKNNTREAGPKKSQNGLVLRHAYILYTKKKKMQNEKETGIKNDHLAKKFPTNKKLQNFSYTV